jgi:hypothetical protein
MTLKKPRVSRMPRFSMLLVLAPRRCATSRLIETESSTFRDEAGQAGAVAADNPALVYLRTGRKTVAINSAGDDKWRRWRRMGVRYVVSLSDGELLNDPRADLRFKLPDKNVWAFELVDPDAATATPTPPGPPPGG